MAPKSPEAQLDHRAEWVIQHMRRHPAMMYRPRIAEIMTGLGVKRSCAEKAYTRALELRSEFTKEVAKTYRDHLIQASLEDEETCRRRGDHRTANKIRETMARVMGLNAPEKLDLSGGIVVSRPPTDYEDMTDEQVEALAKLNEKKTAAAVADDPATGGGETQH